MFERLFIRAAICVTQKERTMSVHPGLFRRVGSIALVILIAALSGCNLSRGEEETPIFTLEAGDDTTTPQATLGATSQITSQPATPSSPAIPGAATATPLSLAATPGLTPDAPGGAAGLPPSPNPSEVGAVYVASSFDTPQTTWSTASDETVTRAVENGAYALGVTSPDTTRWGYTLAPGSTSNPRDVVIEVDARLSQNPGNAAYGLFCRRTEGENYYYFLLNAAGQAQIGRMSGNDRVTLTNWQPVASMNPSDQFNHLRAGCVGSVLWLEVNGILAVRTEDTANSVGGFGPYVVADPAGTARADYDNILIVGR